MLVPKVGNKYCSFVNRMKYFESDREYLHGK